MAAAAGPVLERGLLLHTEPVSDLLLCCCAHGCCCWPGAREGTIISHGARFGFAAVLLCPWLLLLARCSRGDYYFTRCPFRICCCAAVPMAAAAGPVLERGLLFHTVPVSDL